MLQQAIQSVIGKEIVGLHSFNFQTAITFWLAIRKGIMPISPISGMHYPSVPLAFIVSTGKAFDLIATGLLWSRTSGQESGTRLAIRWLLHGGIGSHLLGWTQSVRRVSIQWSLLLSLASGRLQSNPQDGDSEVASPYCTYKHEAMA